MSKVKYTQGPWKISKTNPMDDFFIYQVDEDQFQIAAVTRKYRSKEKNLANAKLIATAPELLEALIIAKHNMLLGKYYEKSELDQINAAIKKATE